MSDMHCFRTTVVATGEKGEKKERNCFHKERLFPREVKGCMRNLLEEWNSCSCYTISTNAIKESRTCTMFSCDALVVRNLLSDYLLIMNSLSPHQPQVNHATYIDIFDSTITLSKNLVGTTSPFRPWRTITLQMDCFTIEAEGPFVVITSLPPISRNGNEVGSGWDMVS